MSASPWLVLLLSLAVTVLAWRHNEGELEAHARERFEARINETTALVVGRLAIYENVLRGGQALLAANPAVDCQQWRKYVGTLAIPERYPGIHGMSFNAAVPGGQLAVFEAALRAAGAPDFAVKPPGERPDHIVVQCIEPMETNAAVVGLDVGAFPRARAAAELAGDSGAPAITERIELVQDDQHLPSFNMFVPVYREGAAPATVEERRAALLGFVVGVVRVDDLLRALLPAGPREVDFQIFDGEELRAETLLHDSRGRQAVLAAAWAAYPHRTGMEVAGRTWTAAFEPTPLFEATADRGRGRLLLAAGVLVIALLAALTLLAANRAARLQELAEARALHEATARNLADGLAIVDRDDRVVFWNRRMEEFFAIRPAEAAGRVLTDLLGSLATLTAEGAPARPGSPEPGSPSTFRYHLDGHPPRDLVVLVFPIPGSDGPRGHGYLVRDMTWERELDRLKGEFISIASHEIRTPLASVLGFSELLLERAGDEAEQREWAELIHAQAERLNRIVQELLDVTRLEEGRVRLEPQPLEVGAAVEQALASARQAEWTHPVERRFRQPLPPVLADREKLAQVLTNLVSNALKYSPAGEPVTVAAEQVGGVVRLSVIDRGLGIPAKELPRLFRRFHRVRDPEREGIEGTGLGLYITKSLVELQGGRIWAESAGPGRGSAFHVELPAVCQEGSRA